MKKLCCSIGLSVLIVFVLFACDKPKVDSIPILCIGIEIVDSNGNNLIGTKLYGDSIKIWSTNYNISAKPTDSIKDVLIVNISDKCWPKGQNDITTTTYIGWNSRDTDTIRAIFGRHAAFYVYDKVYYNDSSVVNSFRQAVYSDYNPKYGCCCIRIIK
ncbi:MAG: hypothetical protein ACFNVV_04270 [Bacteroidota bacterium]